MFNLCQVYTLMSCDINWYGTSGVRWGKIVFTYLFTLYICLQRRCWIYDMCYIQGNCCTCTHWWKFFILTCYYNVKWESAKSLACIYFTAWSVDLSNHTDYTWLCLRTIYFRIFLDILLNGRLTNQSDHYFCLFACEHACLTCLMFDLNNYIWFYIRKNNFRAFLVTLSNGRSANLFDPYSDLLDGWFGWLTNLFCHYFLNKKNSFLTAYTVHQRHTLDSRRR